MEIFLSLLENIREFESFKIANLVRLHMSEICLIKNQIYQLFINPLSFVFCFMQLITLLMTIRLYSIVLVIAYVRRVGVGGEVHKDALLRFYPGRLAQTTVQRETSVKFEET